MDINIRAIDGSAVTVSLDATPNDLHPWTTRTILEYAGRGIHQIIAGNRKFPAAAIGVAGIQLTERATVDSWTVRYGSSEQYDSQGVYIGHLTAAAVLGRAFGCLLHVYNSNADFLLELISMLAFDEASNGIAVESQSRSMHVGTNDTSIIHPTRHIGVLEVRPLTPSRLQTMPSIDGAPTASGGELFVHNLNAENTHYTVLNRTAVTSVVPVTDDSKSDDYITALRSVHAAWN